MVKFVHLVNGHFCILDGLILLVESLLPHGSLSFEDHGQQLGVFLDLIELLVQGLLMLDCLLQFRFQIGTQLLLTFLSALHLTVRFLQLPVELIVATLKIVESDLLHLKISFSFFKVLLEVMSVALIVLLLLFQTLIVKAILLLEFLDHLIEHLNLLSKRLLNRVGL